MNIFIKTKKLIGTLLLIITLVCTVNVAAASTEIGLADLKYSVENEEVTILSCNKNITGDKIIPSIIKGYSVTSIADDAFAECSKLTDITIPDGVTSIGDGAFKGCYNLKSVTLPDTITSIGQDAFHYVAFGGGKTMAVYITNLEEWCKIDFNTPDSNPLAYGDATLYVNGKKVRILEIPNSITSIGNNTFKGCDSIEKIIIHDAVTSIGSNAFASNTRLEDITIPGNVTSIGDRAFYMSGLKNVIVADGVKSIGKEAFAYCGGSFVSMLNITLPSSVTSIGEGAFGIEYNIDKEITVIVDGQTLAFDVPPQLINNRTMVPLRAIFEKLGATVGWDDATQSVIATKGDAYLLLKTQPQNQDVLTISDTRNNVGPISIPVDVLPVVVDGRTLVPVRVISETLGCDVAWDDPTKTVTITSKETTGVGVTMYAADGRSTRVLLTNVEYEKSQGWYMEPVTTMYAADGRTTIILKSETEYYKSQGWYEAPVMTVYNVDGGSMLIYQSEFETYKANGWSTEPVIKLYAPDGRTMVVLQSQMEYEISQGWYTQPVITMYAADGSETVVLQSEKEYYKSQGWITEEESQMESLAWVMVGTYISSMKNPSSAKVYSIYAGYQDLIIGKGLFVIVMDIAGQNSFGGTTRSQEAIVLIPNGGIIELEEYGEKLKKYGTIQDQLKGSRIVIEALELKRDYTKRLTRMNVEKIMEKINR